MFGAHHELLTVPDEAKLPQIVLKPAAHAKFSPVLDHPLPMDFSSSMAGI